MKMEIVGWKYSFDSYEEIGTTGVKRWKAVKKLYSTEKDINEHPDLVVSPGKRRLTRLYSVLLNADDIVEIILHQDYTDPEAFVAYIKQQMDFYQGRRLLSKGK